MKASASNFPPACKLYCLDNLETMGKAVIPSGHSQSIIFRLISSLFYMFLTCENVFLRTRSMEVFTSFASLTCHTQIITQSVNQDSVLQNKIANHLQKKQDLRGDCKLENFLKKLESVTYKHQCECSTLIDDELELGEPPTKKINIERPVPENSELENMIIALKSEALRISNYAASLTNSQRKEISLITDVLYKLVQ